jgi:beta-phosphoglucomutase-like phosphatase (HAD superfamily)
MKLLISDLDGTIVETEDYHRLAYNALFKELGLSQNWSKQDYMNRLQTMGGNKFREVFSWLELPEEEYEDTKTKLYHQKTKLYAELITADLKSGQLGLRPGIRRLFAEVQDAGIPIAIATACVGWAAEQVIEAGLGKVFLQSLAVLCGGESTERKKPHPDIYLLVAEKTGIDPSDCVVLEDTRHGMLAAKSAGMNCLVTPSEFAQDHDLTEADRVSPDLETPVSVVLKDLQSLLSLSSRGQ